MAEVPEAEIEAVEGDEGIPSVGVESFLPFFWDDEGDGVVRRNSLVKIFHEIRFRKLFLRSSTCRHFRSGDQWETDILKERARPLS